METKVGCNGDRVSRGDSDTNCEEVEAGGWVCWLVWDGSEGRNDGSFQFPGCGLHLPSICLLSLLTETDRQTDRHTVPIAPCAVTTLARRPEMSLEAAGQQGSRATQAVATTIW